jgi:hypothetical protein
MFVLVLGDRSTAVGTFMVVIAFTWVSSSSSMLSMVFLFWRGMITVPPLPTILLRTPEMFEICPG